MAVFKKHLTSLSKGGKIQKHEGKGATQELLPSRHALNTLTGGSPADRSMNQYAKATPSVDEAAEDTPSPLTAMLPGG
jgi:hypothetical protein